MTRHIYNYALISFLLLVGIFLVLSLRFAGLDKTPPHWDYAIHLNKSLEFATLIKNGNFFNILSLYHFYPPFIYFVEAILIISFGYQENLVLFLNFSFLIIFLIFIHQYTTSKYKNKYFSITSLILVLGLVTNSEAVGIKIWELLLDFPSMIIILIIYFYNLYYLEKNQLGKINVFALSLLTAIAVLTKWTNIIFLFVPLLFYLNTLFSEKKYKSILIFVLIETTFILPWLINYPTEFFSEAAFFAFTEGAINNDPQNMQALVYYLKHYLNFTGLYLSVLIIGLLLCLKNYYEGFRITTLTLYKFMFFMMPTLVFVFIFNNKDSRYLYPIYFALNLSIFLACFSKLKKILAKALLFLAVLLIVICSLFSLSKIRPFSGAQPLEFIRKELASKKIKSVAYFFERDTRWFNYANVALMHSELRWQNRPIDYFYINSFEVNKDLVSCFFPDFYDYTVNFSSGHSQVSSTLKTCLKNANRSPKRIDFSDLGSLTIYKND